MDRFRSAVKERLGRSSSAKKPDLEVREEKASYPEWAKKLGRVSFLIWNRFLWQPFRYIWNFLNRWTNLTFWIFTGIFIGILVGYFQPEFSQEIEPLGTAFIRMIKIIVAPLIFSTLVLGIAGHSEDISTVGKLAIKTIVYFEIVTTFALAVGLIMANLVKPGEGVILPGEQDNADASDLASRSGEITWYGEMFMIIPENFFIAAAEDQILGIVFCAAMFACAAIKADKKSRDVMLMICESLSQVIFKMVGLIMNLVADAPIGIGASLAATVGANGIGVLANLGKLIGALYASLVIFLLLILFPVILLCRVPMLGFFRSIAQPWLIAFSTSSSESALPKAMEKMREFGCPNSLVSFVIPTGYSFNLDGTTLHLALASIFCAQAGGMSLPVATQLSIMGTLMLSSKGVAAVPRASLIVLAGTVAQYGLPIGAVTVIMGVDAIMDMGRTSINVMGNCLACCVMARLEGSFRGSEWKIEEEARRHKALQDQDPDKVVPTTEEDSASEKAVHSNDVPTEIMIHDNNKSSRSLESYNNNNNSPSTTSSHERK
ncbi:Sodium:dicarboxylate symporter family-domain-containing protein [Zychaea mexicana]|uniref:Sodium:dicarboxylate symporter family-domain-containing protein n=1 Tax=Zychaea mexicana TaxID=64656 RepID=UPI0022FE440F|nr:Sodium:dicarboxylate symporter family-domain-containing protein [Zychaea mexicana]KAI9496169.1 Sodium:dicarboxylate symporter family-domain-containing protein [Zychaea mexicana]